MLWMELELFAHLKSVYLRTNFLMVFAAQVYVLIDQKSQDLD
jgi:hypothetical protein